MAKQIYKDEDESVKSFHVFKSRCVTALCITQLLTWACSLIGTPIAQFSGPNTSCYTLWGYKKFCGDIDYTSKGTESFECSERAKYMSVGAAFAVLSCVFSAISLILFTVSITRVRLLAIMALPFMFLTIITTAISFGAVATVSNKRMCGHENHDGTRYGDLYSYSAGFAFLIIAFFFQIVSFCLLVGLKISGW